MTAVQQIHALWSAFETAGPFAALPYVDAECEWIPSEDLPGAQPLHGTEAMRSYVERLSGDGVRIEPALHTCEALADDTVLVGGRLRVVSRASLSDSPLFWLYRVRDGRIVRIESYATRNGALAAA